MLDKLSLKMKILLLCSLMATLSILVSYFAIDGVKNINRSNSRVVDGIVPKLNDIDFMAIKFKEIRIELRTLGLEGLSQEQRDSAIKNALIAIEEYEKYNKDYNNIPFHEGETELYEKLNSNWLHFKSIGGKVIELEKMRSAKADSVKEMTTIFLKDCPEAAGAFSNSLYALIDFHKKNLAQFVAESKEISEKSNSLIIYMSVFGIVFGVMISLLFANNATKLSKAIIQLLTD